MVYLDTAATTQPAPEVVEVITDSLHNNWHNPSALYNNAKKADLALFNARQAIAKSINAESDEIYFTSGGSESNNWVLQGFVKQALLEQVTPVIITTPIEHKSVLLCCDYLNQTGVDIRYVQVNECGNIKEHLLKKHLTNVREQYKNSKYRVLVSVQYANNEIGTIQNIDLISDIVHSYNAYFHTDAVQVYGKLNIDVKKSNIDFLSASGHKIGATKGIGFLYINSQLPLLLQPLIYGSQNFYMRGGTEDVHAIIGLGVAARNIGRLQQEYSALKSIKADLFEELSKDLTFTVNGYAHDDSKSLNNILSLTFPYMLTGEALIYVLDIAGYEIAAGSACNSSTNEPSYVLKSIGLSDSDALRTIRLSFDSSLKGYEIKEFVQKLQNAITFIADDIKF